MSYLLLLTAFLLAPAGVHCYLFGSSNRVSLCYGRFDKQLSKPRE